MRGRCQELGGFKKRCSGVNGRGREYCPDSALCVKLNNCSDLKSLSW